MKLSKALILCAMLGPMTITARAQALDNTALNGKYYFRHVLFMANSAGSITLATSLSGSITFDGQGKFTFQGQQITAALGPAVFGGNGIYQVLPNGFISMTNPQKSDLQLNARLGVGAIVGSTTEASGTVSDLFIAIPAPKTPVANGTLAGTYQVATLSVPSGIAAQARNTSFTWSATGQGTFNPITVIGHAANLPSRLMTQTIVGATYTIFPDGSGTAKFPFPPGTDVTTALFDGTEFIFISADTNVMIGGSMDTGVHDILIAIKSLPGAATDSSLQGLFFTAGLALQPQGLSSFAGSSNSRGNGTMLSSRRLHSASITREFTEANTYSLNADGSGTFDLLRMAAGDGGSAFLTAALNDSTPGNFELDVGMIAPAFAGTGVFVSPVGVVNAASFAPVGNPVAPGELFTIFGSGLAPQTLGATSFPLPLQLAGVQVLVNNNAVPVIYTSDTQISAIVPIAATGSKVTIVVNNNGRFSNAVDVPLAKAAPGVFSMDLSGTGPGAILHSDFTPVSADSPAQRGETVLVYLTGLGATSPPVGDGLPALVAPLSFVTADVNVLIGGKVAPVIFKGLAPTFAALYQLNVTVPADAPSGPDIPLAISTAEAFTNQVNLAIQ